MKLLERSPYESILQPTESIRPQISFISGPEAPMVSDMLKSLRTGPSQIRNKPADGEAAARAGKYRLDRMDPARVGKNLVMFQPTPQDLPNILAAARLSIPGITKTEEVVRVVEFNPVCVLGLARKSRFDPQAPVAEGLIAFLPLNN